MNEFAQFVLSKLQGSILLILFAIPLLAVGVFIAWLICKKRKIMFSWKKVILWTLLAGYFVALIYVTLLRGGSAEFRSINLHLFRAWREAWNNYTVKNWLNVLLNVAMFVPLGALMPLVSTKLRKWYISMGMALGLSLLIELLQLWRGTGVCDVDDLFANALGAVIGYAAIIFVIAVTGKGKIDLRRILSCGLVLLLTVGNICGIFITYELKEYGNIPNMASFRVNTSDVNWELTCSLQELQEKILVYRTQTYSKEDCEALASVFAQTFEISFDEVLYYDEDAYFMDRGGDNGFHFLTISYLDGSYDYHSGTWEEDSWADADREALITALDGFPLTIPQNAVFSVDGEGWHSFTVDCLILDDVMYDGTIRCRYAADGKIYVIENHLISYRPHGQTEIIIPQKAFDKLCAGDFSGGDYFERREPKNIQVVRAALEYRIDTKGFYRPVYVFDLVATDCGYQSTVMVSAD